jgi:tyrosyl-tRNA synthetase
VLRKLRQFQDLGHQAVLIIGDFTAMIGDPSGKSKTRPPLSFEETRRNGQTYFEQATKVLSSKRLKIVYNSEWLSRMAFADVIRLASKYTVARVLERDDFQKRFRAEEPIGVHEFMYPLAQAFDSVAIQSDVELGGTDQRFNLLVARDIQREYGQEPQAIVIMPILVGTDGREKMSKTLDNYIAIGDLPAEMFGKTMSIPDEIIPAYYQYAAFASAEELKGIAASLARGDNPRDAKAALARRIVGLYWGEAAAMKAEQSFNDLFVKGAIPDDMPEWTPGDGTDEMTIAALLVASGLLPTGSEARRMIQQGGVSIDGRRTSDPQEVVRFDSPVVVRAGKRRFVRVVPLSSR